MHPNEGDTIIYTLTLTNNGPAQATNLSITDLLPAGVTYVSDDGAGGLYIVAQDYGRSEH